MSLYKENCFFSLLNLTSNFSIFLIFCKEHFGYKIFPTMTRIDAELLIIWQTGCMCVCVKYLVSFKFECKQKNRWLIVVHVYRWMTEIFPAKSSLNPDKSFLSRDDLLKRPQLFLFDSLMRVLPLVTLLAGELPSPPPLLLLSEDLSSEDER